MFHGLLRLLSRALGLLIGHYMGSAALAVALSAALPVLKVLYRLRRGFEAVKQNWVRDVGYGAVLSFAFWLLVFGWCVTKIVYEDHRRLVDANTSLRTENEEIMRKLESDLGRSTLKTSKTTEPRER